MGHVCVYDQEAVAEAGVENLKEVGETEVEGKDTKACSVCGKEFPTIRRTIIHEVEECHSLGRVDHCQFKLKIFHCSHCTASFVIKRKFLLHLARHTEQEQEQEQQQEQQQEGEAQVETERDVQQVQQDTENIDPQAGVGDQGLQEGSFEEARVFVEDLTKKEADFLVAVSQLQRLEEGSTTCAHCGKKMSSKKACLEHEVCIVHQMKTDQSICCNQVNVHGDLTNADQYYRCDFCPKIFVNKTLRNNHLTTHTDERKYQVLN